MNKKANILINFFIIIIILLSAIVIIKRTVFDTTFTEEEIIERIGIMKEQSISMCHDRKMSYIMTSTQNMHDYIVYCKTITPIKIYDFSGHIQ